MLKKLLLIVICFISLSYSLYGQGDLLITPVRVVFEGNKQKETLNLVNMGKEVATYYVSFLQYNMSEDGSFQVVDSPDSGQMFADPYLRIFPRKVTLAPGEPQVIMLQYRRLASMVPGEYRSHLYFRAERNVKPLGMSDSAADSTTLDVQIIPVYGISIPIIIRTGVTSVSASISNLKLDLLKGNLHTLNFFIHRTGNVSIYGDLIIEFKQKNKKAVEIGKVKGVGIYTNIEKRKMVVNLSSSRIKSLGEGILRVKYMSQDASKSIVYAEDEIVIK